MADNTDATELLGRDASHELDDVTEPDDAFLIASEQEQSVQAPRRALVVIVTDHPDEATEDTSRLAGELLAEADFTFDGGVDLVLTIGGTGVGPRDKTPEATRAVLDQMVPGVAQALRSSGQACGAVDACTSRGISGVSGSTVIVNVASSRAAVRDGMATLTPLVHHLVDQLQKSSV